MADDGCTTPELEELADEFTIECEIGRGGTAVVYRARDRTLDRLVALKVVRGRLVGDTELVARLEREARLVARLEHPNVVGLHAIRRLRHGGLVLVMQYLAGSTLREELERTGAFSVSRTRRVLTDIARALAAAHGQGVIHRDVKPENIHLIDDSGHALLSDFGSAAPLEHDGRLTIPGMTIGTPGYMAPELVDGASASPAADVYSLGLVGWEMLSGRQPWSGSSLFEVLAFRKHGRLPAVDTFRADVAPAFARIIERAMHGDPSLRWHSAEAMLGALEVVAEAPEAAVAAFRTLARPAGQPAEGGPGTAVVTDNATIAFARPTDIAPPGPPVREAARPGLPVPLPAEPPVPVLVEGEAVVPHHIDELRELAALLAHEPGEPVARRWNGRRYTVAAAAGTLLVAAAAVAAMIRGAPEPAPTIALGGDVATPLEVPISADSTGRFGAPLAPLDSTAMATADSLPATTPVDGRPVLTPVGGAASSVPAAPPAPSPPPQAAQAAQAPAERASQPTRWRIATGRVPRVSLPAISAGAPARMPDVGGRVASSSFDAQALGRTAGDPALAEGATTADGGLAAREVRVGGTHSCALLPSGQVSCWGANEYGQLGSRAAGGSEPLPVSSAASFRALALGQSHSCGLTTQGGTLCWGANDRGQLGDGTRTATYLPGQVVGVPRLVSLAVGVAHSCGADPDGEVYCWGSNASGQLGTGDDADRRVGTALAGGLRARAVVTGWHHSCAVSTEGQAYCWGANAEGQLGLDGGDRRAPVLVSTVERLKSLVAGSAHTCALTEAESVLCWGRNRDGQLGDGTRTAARVPRPVALPGPVLALAAGAEHTCALLRRGDVYCWGQNRHGQLGSGNTRERATPTLVAGAPSFVALDASGAHTCGVTAARAVLCWGANAQGQLGDGTRISRPRPVPVRRATE